MGWMVSNTAITNEIQDDGGGEGITVIRAREWREYRI
jgi:hypothetical protein